MSTHRLHRRFVLKASGAAIGLPLLDAMCSPANADQDRAASIPRTVMICAGLGFHAPFLFPQQQGKDYSLTPYLELISDHRKDFTLFSGLSHPEQNGNNGHASSLTWLTSARRPGLAGFKNTISLDQLIADHCGTRTRLPFLCLSNDGGSLSWTANGINIPAESSPSRIYKTLFVEGSESDVQAQLKKLRRGRSILDSVMDEARQLNRTLGPRDRHKLQEYFTAIRDLESRMTQAQQWATRPKPKVDYPQPEDVADRKDIVARQRLMYDMIVLSLQTDSTRVVTLSLGSMNAVPSNIPGVKSDWHNLSHHGRDEEKIRELRLIEEAELREFNGFLSQLRSVTENDRPLLKNTAVLFGSNLGNASAHDWHNLPIILAGGDYRHGAHVAHDPVNNTPLANLFVALANRMGVPVDRFGSSTSQSIRGLETI